MFEFIEEIEVLTARRVRDITSPSSWRPASADNKYGAKLPENPPISRYQGKMACKSMVRLRKLVYSVSRWEENRSQAMAEEQKPPGWWHTLPGILTAMAGIISAIAALVLALHQAGVLEKGDKPTTRVPSVETTRPRTPPNPVPDRAEPGRATAPDGVTLKALSRARSLILERGPSQAAGLFVDALQGKAYYTIVVRDNCDSYTVRQAIFSVPKTELIVLPLPGAGCYRVGWGLYTSEAEARAARQAIDDRLRQFDPVVDGRVESVAETGR
jgi:hypothetical protein